MLIKDLPIELQKLVHQRQIEQGNDGLFDGDLIVNRNCNNFEWHSTPEKYSFWEDVYYGKDMRSHPAYPKLDYYFY